MAPVDYLKRFKIDKIIRDKIPEVMRNQGIIVHEKVIDALEFVHRLKEKLAEEAREVIQAQTKEELAEELADILEVVRTLAQEHELSFEEIEQVRLNKRFERRIYSPFVDIHESNPAIHYYSSSSLYPEISQHSSCLFCQVASHEKEAEIIAKFEHCFVLKDRFPISKGHLLIIPYKHIPDWFTATELVRLDIIRALNAMKAKLDAEYHPNGYNIGANCGEVAGQAVMHLHVHLIPRYEADMTDPKG